MKSVSALFEDLNVKSRGALLFNAFFIVRRLLFVFICIFMKEWPFLQIIILFYQCLLMLIYLGSVKPFIHSYMNNLEKFNEITILAVSYHLLVFSDYVESLEIKFYCGYSIIALTCFNIFINMAAIIYFSL